MANGCKKAFDTVMHRCIDFVLFLKGKILREFQNIEKFVIFWEKHDFEKDMYSYVSNVGFNRTRGKRLDLRKNRVSFKAGFH